MKPFRGRRRESTGERMLAEELGARRAVGLIVLVLVVVLVLENLERSV
jgi:hypothetical protein